MPDAVPPIGAFIPANCLTPVSFEHAHGKMLMSGLRLKIRREAVRMSLTSGSTLTGRIASKLGESNSVSQF
jgi:hypothetical protein